MAQKKLEPKSQYAKYDVDGDGIVSDEELSAIAKLEELEMQEEKAEAQRRMAWVTNSTRNAEIGEARIGFSNTLIRSFFVISVHPESLNNSCHPGGY